MVISANSSKVSTIGFQGGWLLLALLIVTFSLRVYYAFYGEPHWYSNDSFAYVRQAESIISGEWGGKMPQGYPIIIAGFSVVFDQYRDAALILFNCIIWSICALITYVLVQERTGSRNWALLGALIVSVWPTHFVWARSILTEAPTAFFLTSGMMFIWFRRYLVGCLLLAICVMIRPTLLPLLAVLSIIVGLRNGWKQAVIVLFVTLVPYVSMGAYAKMKLVEQHSTHFSEALLLADVHRSELGYFKYNGQSTKEALDIYIHKITNDPVRYVILRVHFLNMLWGPWPERHQLARGSSTSISVNILIGLQFPLIVLGFYSLFLRRDLFSIFLLSPALVITTVHVVLFATSRYNVPVVPLLTVMATDGAFMFYSRICRSRFQRKLNVEPPYEGQKPGQSGGGGG